MIIIYLATNILNKKRYIGQTSQKLERRKQAHINDKRTSTLLSKAIRKYGADNFEWKVLAECQTGRAADDLERRMIVAFGTHCKSHGYNRAIGGKSRRGFKHTAETLEKFKRRQAWNKGTKGLTKSWNKGVSGWTVPEPRRHEARERVSHQMKGNDYAKGNTNNRKAVRCIETGEVFLSLYHASYWVRGKFNRSQISAVCNGKRKTAYGYRWEFVCQQ